MHMRSEMASDFRANSTLRKIFDVLFLMLHYRNTHRYIIATCVGYFDTTTSLTPIYRFLIISFSFGFKKCLFNHHVRIRLFSPLIKFVDPSFQFGGEWNITFQCCGKFESLVTAQANLYLFSLVLMSTIPHQCFNQMIDSNIIHAIYDVTGGP